MHPEPWPDSAWTKVRTWALQSFIHSGRHSPCSHANQLDVKDIAIKNTSCIAEKGCFHMRIDTKYVSSNIALKQQKYQRKQTRAHNSNENEIHPKKETKRPRTTKVIAQSIKHSTFLTTARHSRCRVSAALILRISASCLDFSRAAICRLSASIASLVAFSVAKRSRKWSSSSLSRVRT